MNHFTCNVCGASNQLPQQPFDREAPSCAGCGSSVRVRGLLHALSNELLGTSLALPDFPRIRSLRGLGMSDGTLYADHLRDKLDYRNTFFDKAPRFDLLNPPPGDLGIYDFLLAAEVFEHIQPPIETAFSRAFSLLKSNGVLVFTVPYSLDLATVEHFPQLHEFGLSQVGGKTVLVNRSAAGELDATDKVVFHVGCTGHAPELREFSEAGLRTSLAAAGFQDVRIYSEGYAPFGILWQDTWSLPIAARRGPFGLSADASREIVEHWQTAQGQIKQIGRNWWFRMGRKLKVCR